MNPKKIEQLRAAMRALPEDVREEIVSQLHELAGRIALDDKARVLQILQDLDKVFEVVE